MKSKIAFLILPLTLFTLFTLTQTPVWAEDTLLGKWVRVVEVDRNLTLSMRLEVTDTNSTFGMTCEVSGAKGDVEIKIATKIDGWNYHILEKGVDAKDVGDFDCRLILQPGIWNYDLSGDDLKLVTNNGDLLFMKRVK